MTIEEGSIGGFAAHVTRYLSDNGLLDNGLRFRSMTFPDQFIPHAKPQRQYELAQLNAEHIVKTVLAACPKTIKRERA